jgi:hypothetical protein
MKGWEIYQVVVWTLSYAICILNNNVLLVTLGNFEPHPTLVNVNKLNPYMYVEEIIKHQHVV